MLAVRPLVMLVVLTASLPASGGEVRSDERIGLCSSEAQAELLAPFESKRISFGALPVLVQATELTRIIDSIQRLDTCTEFSGQIRALSDAFERAHASKMRAIDAVISEMPIDLDGRNLFESDLLRRFHHVAKHVATDDAGVAIVLSKALDAHAQRFSQAPAAHRQAAFESWKSDLARSAPGGSISSGDSGEEVRSLLEVHVSKLAAQVVSDCMRRGVETVDHAEILTLGLLRWVEGLAKLGASIENGERAPMSRDHAERFARRGMLLSMMAATRDTRRWTEATIDESDPRRACHIASIDNFESDLLEIIGTAATQGAQDDGA